MSQRDITQAWARWLYAHPRLGVFAGLVYSSYHTAADCFVLWERAEPCLEVADDLQLDSPAVEDDLARVAYELNLVVGD